MRERLKRAGQQLLLRVPEDRTEPLIDFLDAAAQVGDRHPDRRTPVGRTEPYFALPELLLGQFPPQFTACATRDHPQQRFSLPRIPQWSGAEDGNPADGIAGGRRQDDRHVGLDRKPSDLFVVGK